MTSHDDCYLNEFEGHTYFWIQLQASLESLDRHRRNCNLYVVSSEPEIMKAQTQLCKQIQRS